MTDEPVSGGDIEKLLEEAQAGLPPASAPQPPVEESAEKAAERVLASVAAGAASGSPSSGTATPKSARPSAAARDDTIAPADVELLIRQAQEAIASIDQPQEPSSAAAVKAFHLDEFTGAPPSTERATLELIRDVELDLRIEFGRTQMYLEDVLKLRKGSVVPLDKLAGDPVDIFVNGRLIAKGEVLVLNDNFCVRVAELISGEQLA
jgi:flagellar motor switch protein FliN